MRSVKPDTEAFTWSNQVTSSFLRESPSACKPPHLFFWVEKKKKSHKEVRFSQAHLQHDQILRPSFNFLPLFSSAYIQDANYLLDCRHASFQGGNKCWEQGHLHAFINTSCGGPGCQLPECMSSCGDRESIGLMQVLDSGYSPGSGPTEALRQTSITLPLIAFIGLDVGPIRMHQYLCTF